MVKYICIQNLNHILIILKGHIFNYIGYTMNLGSLAAQKTITADIIIDIIKWGFYGRKTFDRLERKTH